jgi:N-acetylglucosaminyldiphosphoundecaprenol N-acetyl-beta-D-mannosaminyltransferase
LPTAEYYLAIDESGLPALPPVFLRADDASASIIDLESARRRKASRDDSRPPIPWQRVPIGRAHVDCLTYDQAVAAVCDLARIDGHREYVVTPNIQHVAELRRGGDFAAAYADAALVLPDGAPVVMALRALTGRKQSRVTGADLLPGICRSAAVKGLTVGILGGRPGAAQEAADRLRADYPGLDIVLVEPAPFGFEQDPAELERVLSHVERLDPDILFVGLGSPKGEVFAHQHRARLGNGVVMCIGAAIDFTAGFAVRAPLKWQQRGCEWLWRLLHEPRRLAGRYAKAAPLFVVSVLPALVESLVNGGRRRH